jgi:23S rRNA (cytidine1920-2'-O)/16S rRNA (cytidine1409-2'-O)-methyltransferase
MCARRRRFVNVVDRVRSARPDIEDPLRTIDQRLLVADGRIVTDPRSLVRWDAIITVRRNAPLRGEAKLRAALDAFAVHVADRICLDVGASAGGFTRVLLERGARRVYALDAGFGQLRGELRIDPRVVNLERTNVADAARSVRDVEIDIVTLDLSYLSIAGTVPYLEGVRYRRGADLIALVKPMYELGLATPPDDDPTLGRALEHAIAGLEAGSWRVCESIRSPLLGSRGAIEWLVHARTDSRIEPTERQDR